MLEAGLILLAVLSFSLVIQEKFKVPMPITVIGTVLLLASFNIKIFDVNNALFDQVVLLLLPLLLTVDILHLNPKELKQNWLSVFGTAGVAVVLSIVAGLVFQSVILPDHAIGTAAMVALMTMVVATDPVTVAAVFGNYNLPHRLKFLAESESLHNDATAFIIFSIAVLLMTQDMSTSQIAGKAVSTLLGAVAVGALIGYLGLQLLRMSHEPITEAFIILFVAMGAFWGAEHFHFAGILAVVVSVVFMTSFIYSQYEKLQARIEAAEAEVSSQFTSKRLLNLEHLVHTYQNQKQIIKVIGFTALIANAVLFVSMADLINFSLLRTYWQEIVAVFIATTLIRGGVLALFAKASNATKKMQDISPDWWAILTFAGVKGGLSILMLHMLPQDYEHLALFEAIVIGNIILSTLVYSLALTLIIAFRQTQINLQTIR